MKNFRSSRRSACLSAVSASPVSTSIWSSASADCRRTASSSARTSVDLGDHDAVEVAGLAEQLLGGAEVGGDHRRAGDPLDLAEHRLTDERQLDRAGLGQDGERVADRPAFVGHGGAVDDGLVGRLGSAPVGELERVEPRVVDPRRSDRRSQFVVGDRTVVTDELGEALDRAGRGVDSVDLEHVGERRLVDALTNLGHVAFDRRFTADDRVDAFVVGGEHVVERAPHGVGEDHRPRHERDAEDDGEAGQQEAELVGPQAFEGESEHVSIVSVAGTRMRRPVVVVQDVARRTSRDVRDGSSWRRLA